MGADLNATKCVLLLLIIRFYTRCAKKNPHILKRKTTYIEKTDYIYENYIKK